MKNTLLLATAVLLLASCSKKDRTCTCVITTSSSANGTSTQTSVITISDRTKGEAKDLCDDISHPAETSTVTGVTTTAACQLN